MNKIYYGNTISNWLISLGIIAGAFILGKAIYWVLKNVFKKMASKTKTDLDYIFVDMIEEPIMMGIILAGFWYGARRLTFTDNIDDMLSKVIYGVIIINITWLIARLVNALYERYIIPLADKTDNAFDNHILPVGRSAIKFIIWSLGIVIALNNVGIKVLPLLTGVGIGGFAFAMAGQDTIGNAFGGITIYFDKPFKIKDRVKVMGFDGFIEEVGLRSTRLRTLEGTQVTIPNSTFVEEPIENVSREKSRRVKIGIGLTYGTSPDKMQEAIDILDEITETNENIWKDHLAYFESFGDFSLNIIFIYYIKKKSDIFKTQTAINLEIMRKYKEAGLEMAFPTQTIELKKFEE